MYKRSILLGLVAGAAGLFWFWVEPWVASPIKFADVSVWLRPLVMLGVLSACAGLAFLLMKGKLWRLITSGLIGLPFFLIFGYDHFYLAALLIMLLLHLRAVKQIHMQEEGRIKVDVREIMNYGLPSVITPILIMISFAFFLSPAVQSAAKKGELPPTAYEVVSRVVSGFLGQELQALPSQERKQAEVQLINQVIDKFNQLLGPYFVFLPPVLAFGLFLILQGLSFVFVWIGVAISVLLFWIFKKSGIVQIRVVQKEAEELDFL